MNTFDDFALSEELNWTDDEIVQAGEDVMAMMRTPGWSKYILVVQAHLNRMFKRFIHTDGNDGEAVDRSLEKQRLEARGMMRCGRLATEIIAEANKIKKNRRDKVPKPENTAR